MKLQLFLCMILFSLVLHATETKKLITIFAHGLGRNEKDIERYHKDVILTEKSAFNFPEACNQPSGVGHGPDMHYLQQQFHENNDYIGLGFSRGAAALLKLAAENNCPNLKALVSEGAPCDVVDLVRDVQLKTVGIDFFPCRIARECIFKYLFPSYPLCTPSVLKQLKEIKNKELPIFLLHSKQDKRVPITSTWQIYITLKKAGCPHVYLHEVEEGDHGLALYQDAITITQQRYGSKVDTRRFTEHQHKALRSLHMFYKKHNLPYNPIWSNYQHPNETTPFTLQQLQPSIEEIETKIIKEENKLYQFQNLLAKTALITTLTATLTYASLKYIHFAIQKR